MARDITSGFTDEINANALQPVRLAKCEFDSGDILLWNGLGQISYDGEIYSGAGVLLDISDIKESQDLQSHGVSFKLSGIDSSVTALAQVEKIRGRKISCFDAVLDENWQIIADPYRTFSGSMDGMSMREDGSNSSVTIVAENDMSDLTVVRESRYTPEYQKSVYPEDKGLDFLPKIQDVSLTWGVDR